MQKAKRQLLILSNIVLLAACSSGSSGENESMAGVKVKSVFPPSGITDLGLGAEIELHINKNLKPETIKRYVSLIHQRNNGQIGLEVSGGNGLYHIRPQHLLEPATTYVFNIQLESPLATRTNLAAKDATPNSYTLTTQPAYKIFLSANSVKGDLNKSESTKTKPKDIVDNWCNTDSHRTDDTSYFKAMLGIDNVRYACEDKDYCGAGHNLDWVLQPSTSYYNSNNELIATTNAFATFAFPSSHSIMNLDAKVWTGLDDNWVNSSDCEVWTSKSSGHKGRVGWAKAVDKELITYGKHTCDHKRTLYCVQQPQAVITAPALSPINQYLTVDNMAPITVSFNSLNPINPNTVTSSSFVVIASNSTTPVPGKIVSNNDNSFTFTPSVAYAAATSYVISLTNAILDNQGKAIMPTTLFFTTPAQTKLMFMTKNDYWGNVGGISGADSKCQADAQCPSGKTCKAILMDVNDRYACTAKGVCGGVNSKDWVLAPSTTYINTKGQIIATTNTMGTFGNNGQFVFNYPISDGGKAWTGFDNNFMIKYKDGKPVTCSHWSIGDSGINALGGLYGNSASLYPYAFTQSGGGCSKYTNKIDYGVYVDKQCNVDGGCSPRHLYCAEQ